MHGRATTGAFGINVMLVPCPYTTGAPQQLLPPQLTRPPGLINLALVRMVYRQADDHEPACPFKIYCSTCKQHHIYNSLLGSSKGCLLWYSCTETCTLPTNGSVQLLQSPCVPGVPQTVANSGLAEKHLRKAGLLINTQAQILRCCAPAQAG
ncbi:hypothetical protein COO60DRAFT_285487 [Scenedesmus sp. NREL 46B-D3]|nr:hypothetical protein COO60DRAFT_285487 [Scenedesmus sp. NREL 46B-D3]